MHSRYIIHNGNTFSLDEFTTRVLGVVAETNDGFSPVVIKELAFAIPAHQFDSMELVLGANGQLLPLRPVPRALALLETKRLLGAFKPAAVEQASHEHAH